MPSNRCAACLVIAMVLVSGVAAETRDELLATPKFAEDAKQPAFAELTAEQVAAQITMVSGRNYAWFGFNTPEIHVVLPSADNSVYADVDFVDPALYDAGGAEVPYELERGLYDHDSHHDEIRFVPVEGDELVDFSRAVGTVTLRYPLRLHTISARKDGPPVDGLDVSFDGPYVTRRTTSGEEDLEVAAFLVEAGADVNLADTNNATPLFHAAGKCDAVSLVRELLAAGADPAPATRGGTTAVEMAGIMGCGDNEAAIKASLGG